MTSKVGGRPPPPVGHHQHQLLSVRPGILFSLFKFWNEYVRIMKCIFVGPTSPQRSPTSTTLSLRGAWQKTLENNGDLKYLLMTNLDKVQVPKKTGFKMVFYHTPLGPRSPPTPVWSFFGYKNLPWFFLSEIRPQMGETSSQAPSYARRPPTETMT